MIESALFTLCKCHMALAELCPNHPPPELLYEVEVKLKGVKEDADHRDYWVGVGSQRRNNHQRHSAADSQEVYLSRNP